MQSGAILSHQLLEQNEDTLAAIVENLQLARFEDCLKHFTLLKTNLISLAMELDNFPAADEDPFQFVHKFKDGLMRKHALEEFLPFELRGLPSSPSVGVCSNCQSLNIPHEVCRNQFQHVEPSASLSMNERDEYLVASHILSARHEQFQLNENKKKSKRNYNRWDANEKYTLFIGICLYGSRNLTRLQTILPHRSESKIRRFIFKNIKPDTLIPSLSELLENPPPNYDPPRGLEHLFQHRRLSSSPSSSNFADLLSGIQNQFMNDTWSEMENPSEGGNAVDSHPKDHAPSTNGITAQQVESIASIIAKLPTQSDSALTPKLGDNAWTELLTVAADIETVDTRGHQHNHNPVDPSMDTTVNPCQQHGKSDQMITPMNQSSKFTTAKEQKNNFSFQTPHIKSTKEVTKDHHEVTGRGEDSLGKLWMNPSNVEGERSSMSFMRDLEGASKMSYQEMDFDITTRDIAEYQSRNVDRENPSNVLEASKPPPSLDTTKVAGSSQNGHQSTLKTSPPLTFTVSSIQPMGSTFHSNPRTAPTNAPTNASVLPNPQSSDYTTHIRPNRNKPPPFAMPGISKKKLQQQQQQQQQLSRQSQLIVHDGSKIGSNPIHLMNDESNMVNEIVAFANTKAGDSLHTEDVSILTTKSNPLLEKSVSSNSFDLINKESTTCDFKKAIGHMELASDGPNAANSLWAPSSNQNISTLVNNQDKQFQISIPVSNVSASYGLSPNDQISPGVVINTLIPRKKSNSQSQIVKQQDVAIVSTNINKDLSQEKGFEPFKWFKPTNEK